MLSLGPFLVSILLSVAWFGTVPAHAGNSGERGGGTRNAIEFRETGRRLSEALALHCRAVDPLRPLEFSQRRLAYAMKHLVTAEQVSAVCGKGGVLEHLNRAIPRTRVIPSAEPLSKDGLPRDIVNNRKDEIVLGPSFLDVPAGSIDDIRTDLALVIHEYLSVEQAEESDQYPKSTAAVQMLESCGVTDLVQIYGDLPKRLPVRTFTKRLRMEAPFEHTLEGAEGQIPVGQVYDEPCLAGMTRALSKALAECQRSGSEPCKMTRFELLKVEIPKSSDLSCRIGTCDLACTVRVTVGAYVVPH